MEKTFDYKRAKEVIINIMIVMFLINGFISVIEQNTTFKCPLIIKGIYSIFFIILGIIALVWSIKYEDNMEDLKRKIIEKNDERNVLIDAKTKAHAYSFLILTLLIASTVLLMIREYWIIGICGYALIILSVIIEKITKKKFAIKM